MIRVFFNVIKQYQLRYAGFAVLYIVLAAAAATAGLVSARIAGNMTYAADLGVSDEMMGFLLVLAIAGTVQAVLNSLTAILRQRAYGNTGHSIRKAFARCLLHIPYKEFTAKNSGEGTSLFTNDVPLAAEFVTTQTLSQISQLTTLIVSAVYMLLINWWLTLIYFALFPLLALMQSKLSVPISKKSLEASKWRAECVAVVSDALQNQLTIKSYGLEASVERRFDDSFMQLYKAQYDSTKISVILKVIGIFATFIPTFVLGLVACATVINGGMTVAEFIALTIISGPVGNWLMLFAQDLALLRQAAASVSRVTQYTQGNVNENINENITLDVCGEHAITFYNVSFGYSEDAKVFENISFTVKKGSITAIVGSSGCGKALR